MRIHELLNTKPLVEMSEATTSGTQGTEPARKPYKPYRPCRARKPRKPYTTEEASSNEDAGSTAAIAARTIIVEAATRPYQSTSTTDPKKERFRDFLLRLAEQQRAENGEPTAPAAPNAE